MNKTVFITGAGSGLGRGAAFGLARQGHRIIATTETTSQKTDVLRQAEAEGLDMDVFKLDITNPRDLMQIRETDFDIFVANAAINEGGPLAEVPLDRVRALFEVNIFATLESVQLAAARLVGKGHGKVIFMSSMAGISATPFVGPYTATKHAIEGIAQTMRKELEPFGVQVATINPGAYDTGFNDRAGEEIWKWFDDSVHFTRKEDILKQQENLKNQFDPQDMIDKMVEIIPKDHHPFRTVHPQETEDQLKKAEKKRWEMEI
ncbi:MULTISPECIES: SDR family oxidoreductase [Bhargavaea]|uniref:SDR family oxidoreductase n=1 Tax=Bhargavaea changchunensis TaxID=2134037 RepID=A0ABW2NGB8_9BACL|nr:SDR family oxidoreductase [Bhargavaea sp. CC-171006]